MRQGNNEEIFDPAMQREAIYMSLNEIVMHSWHQVVKDVASCRTRLTALHNETGDGNDGTEESTSGERRGARSRRR